MTKTKKIKHVDYFPCPCGFLNALSPYLSSSSDDDDDDDDDDNVDVGSCSNSSSNSDDVRPSKLRKLEKRKGLSSDEFTESSSSSDSWSSDSWSSFNLWCNYSLDDERHVDNYLRPDMMKEGEKVDLISYLSSKSRDLLVDKNGGKVSLKSCIQGKYVILIWLQLPIRSWSFAGYTCWALHSACSTSINWSANVEVVLVPSVTPGWEEEDKEHAFVSFLLGLPSCLAIPLWDSNFATALYKDMDPHTIVFDPNQTVLQTDCCYDIMHFRADSYPFTDGRFLTLKETSRELLTGKPFPLKRLLGLDLSDCLSNVAGDAKITVSQLKQKLVGVFVAHHFLIFDAVHQAYQDCLAKGRELEIVLACINLADDPQHYMDSVYAALRDYNDKGKGYYHLIGGYFPTMTLHSADCGSFSTTFMLERMNI